MAVLSTLFAGVWSVIAGSATTSCVIGVPMRTAVSVCNEMSIWRCSPMTRSVKFQVAVFPASMSGGGELLFQVWSSSKLKVTVPLMSMVPWLPYVSCIVLLNPGRAGVTCARSTIRSCTLACSTSPKSFRLSTSLTSTSTALCDGGEMLVTYALFM